MHGLAVASELLLQAPDNHETGGIAIADALLAAATPDGDLPATAIAMPSA